MQPAAFGLFVPGAGGKVSREGAVASLRRGKVENALLGGKPGGKVIADLVFGMPQGDVTRPVVYVELPPAGKHPNTKRYPVAFVGGGYRGILTSHATRIDGLVPVADIAPTLVALEEGSSPPIRSKPDADATADLRSLDRRLTRVHRDRGWTLTMVALTLLALCFLFPRASILAGAAFVAVALWLSATGTTRFWEVLVWMGAAGVSLAFLAAQRRRALPFVVALFFLAFLLVLTLSPETNSLAVLGPRPDGGGRFYGVSNQVATLL